MKKIFKYFVLMMIIGLSIILCGCQKKDPIEDFYDTYTLGQVAYGYYDYSGGPMKNGFEELPRDSVLFPRPEQEAFFRETLLLLGTRLVFEKNYLRFSGDFKNEVQYTYTTVYSDKSFSFYFDDVFEPQEEMVQKSIRSGSASVSRAPASDIIIGRSIRIVCTYYTASKDFPDYLANSHFTLTYYLSYL